MYIDMHCHSVASDDSRATVEQYLKWITVLRKKGYIIDGIVLTEHRQFNKEADYSELSEKYNVLILKGSELDTRYGHFLVYGVNDHLMKTFNFKDVRMDGIQLMKEAEASEAIAIPAHPGRFGIGLVDFIKRDGVKVPDLWVVERLNGGSRAGENERAEELCREHGLMGIGGGDAHFASALATCVTRFDDFIRNEKDLVRALYGKRFQPVRLEETKAEESRELVR